MSTSGNPRLAVRIQHTDFDIAALQRELLYDSHSEGAVAAFTGYVRVDEKGGDIEYLELEYYPKMTENCIESIMFQAAQSWPLKAASVVHRVGRLLPGEQIVWVGVSSSHRDAAFCACEYIMDYLKTEAPLWKKEGSSSGERWVEAKRSDTKRLSKWSGGAVSTTADESRKAE